MKKMFKFKAFQRHDYSRAALHDGLILASDTGTGKSIAAFTFPLLKCGFEKSSAGKLAVKGRVLIVAPEQLHPQLMEEGVSKFGITCTKIDRQETYLKMTRGGTEPLPNGFYITSYTQLGSNGVDKFPDFTKEGGRHTKEEVKEACKVFGVTKEEFANFKRIYDIWYKKEFITLEPPSNEMALSALLKQKSQTYGNGLGEEVNGFLCVWSPSLSDLCRNAFDCVVIDEGVRIKGDDTLIALGVRNMRPKYRLVLTATPIKNRLQDMFWLLWWAAGGRPEAHARFPYAGTEADKSKFEAEFLVDERNLTKEKKENNGRVKSDWVRRGERRRGKKTAEVCNIHRIWKLIAPIVLRRLKSNIGEDIVAKVRNPIRVPMGTAQARVYQYHMEASYEDKNGQPALGAQLQALRSAAASPNSDLLANFGEKFSNDKVTGERIKLFHQSPYDYTPKVAAALTKIAQIVRAGEQVAVFSALHEPLDTLARKLTEAGVPFYLLDGRTSAKSRGKQSQEFQKGRPHAKPVMLAGIGAMSEGHNWFRANHAILLAYDWAMDKYEQAINRVHRLNSPKTVHVWPIICNGTIDLKLESLTAEKCDSSELVLDGRLLEEAEEEINLATLLKIAKQEFSAADTLDEQDLALTWPDLKAELKAAWEDTKTMGAPANAPILPDLPKPIALPVVQVRIPRTLPSIPPVYSQASSVVRVTILRPMMELASMAG